MKDIQFLINNGIEESQNLEYKQPNQEEEFGADCDNIARILSSFLNTDGGIIVYGVSEKREKVHNRPAEIKWCTAEKERIENLLLSRVQPWDENTRIKRIENKTKRKEGIFVIEVPKSNNPPHMYNSIYYQRLNYQTKPMGHESVLRAFQSSYTRRRDIVKKVIEPLYAEITEICERLQKFKSTSVSKQPQIKLHDRYLYDQLNPTLTNRIDEFYERVVKLQPVLDWQAYKIAIKIIRNQLIERFPRKKEAFPEDSNNNILELYIKTKDVSGNIENKRSKIAWALFKKQTIDEYLKAEYPHETIAGYTPEVTPSTIKFSKEEFEDFWKKCQVSAKQNDENQKAWNEITELLEIGKKILEEIKVQA
ncbi:MAG: ATP-binding protein [Candidatus Bathyarchaeota archaeon]|nr:ATP-binding protein [Candidatus Bathyarchaeota archaeon]